MEGEERKEEKWKMRENKEWWGRKGVVEEE